MAGTCPVCGTRTDAPACPRCATILAPGRATCPSCGRAFSGRVAVCDACGDDAAAGDLDAGGEEAVRGLSLVPGVDERTARALYERGFRDFSEVIALGLPDAAVAKGLHHTITRKLLLRTVSPKKPSRIGRADCPSCGVTVLEGAAACPACGGALGPEAEEAYVRKRLAAVPGSERSPVEDPDFLSMPDPVRREILDELGSMLDGSVPDDEVHRQIEAWKGKGFDVGPILLLLAQHPSNFRERAVRIIRAQIRKKMEGGRFLCPLCRVDLASTAEECPNCGAKFA